MATSECTGADRLSGADRASRSAETADLAIGGLIHQLSEVISAVGSYRADAEDGIGWVSLDRALCSLHSAVVALEEFGADRAQAPACIAVAGSDRSGA
ncbi:MAG: hypothetical protein ABSF33_02410 [Acidimicrobiales bacterium]|jgi:hypothetical protein